jgi:hypothetical protein
MASSEETAAGIEAERRVRERYLGTPPLYNPNAQLPPIARNHPVFINP